MEGKRTTPETNYMFQEGSRDCGKGLLLAALKLAAISVLLTWRFAIQEGGGENANSEKHSL
jgi:hypothetical protein